MKLTLILLSILASCLLIGNVLCEDEAIYNCSTKYTLLETNQGKLRIVKDQSPCGFLAKEEDKYFAIKTEDLSLKANDRLSLSSKNLTKSYEFKAPLNKGFIVSGLPGLNVTFNFETLDKSSMITEFMMTSKPLSIPIDGDVNNEVRITPLDVKNINVSFTKSIPGTVHLEVVGAHIMNGIHPKHALIQESTSTLNLRMIPEQTVTVKTSPVSENCSKIYLAQDDGAYHLEGPPASVTSKGYKCVNLFAEKSDAAIFVVDFKNFIDIVDDEDHLIIDDGQSKSKVFIVKADASDYTGQVRYFKGDTLAVVYDSPRVIHPSNIQFELTVESKTNVTVVEAVKSLNFSRPIQYVLQPQREEYASIETSTLDLKSSITISSERFDQVKFDVLPPILAINEAGSPMIIDYSSKSKSYGAVNYMPLTTNCHRLSTTTSDGFSVTNITGSCIWTIAPKNPIILKFDYINLPNGCLILTKLPSKKEVFNRCNLSPTDVLPPIMIEKAYVNVTLTSNESRLDATISHSPVSDENKISLGPVANIASPSYPVAYALSDSNTVYVLDAKGKSYALSVLDMDLRNGEKLMIDNNAVDNVKRHRTGVMNITNKVTTIRIDRSKVDMNDLGNHRGFKMQAEKFDRIIAVDKNPFEMPKNLTNVLLRISTPTKLDNFGKRIEYNITFNPPAKIQNYSVSVIDSRVLNGRPIVGEKFHDSSTSDTILIRYATTASNVTLPPMKIAYNLIECNRTLDHVCDNQTRCVPKEKCKINAVFCDDETDRLFCAGITPIPPPKIIETGVGGVTVFFLSVIMLVIGALSALYGPDLIRMFETRLRSGQYTTFTSSD